MKVLFFATECKPFSKVGGVGDVALELPVALRKEGIDIEVVTPLYSSVNKKWVEDKPYFSFTHPFKDKDGISREEKVSLYRSTTSDVKVTFIQNETYFEGEYGVPYLFSSHTPFYDDFIRFHFFSEASLALIDHHKPDIIHCNDWGLGFLLGKLKMLEHPAKRVFSIHNNLYQGNIWIPAIRNWEAMEFIESKATKSDFKDPRKKWNSVNPLKLGILSADAVNAVSPTYKKEMLQKDNPRRYFYGAGGLQKATRYQEKKGKMYGILNGFEYVNTENYEETLKEKERCKKDLSSHFENPDNVLFGFVGRAVEQKFKLLQEIVDGQSVLEHLTENKKINIAILASGMAEYEEFLERFKDMENVSVTLAFDKELAEKISIGCDIFLMPSLYEPCGITQMQSLSNATPPLVRAVGGLKDTVVSYKKSKGTGFIFSGKNNKLVLRNLIESVNEATELYYKKPEKFDKIRREAFKQRFLWSDSAKSYIRMYNELF